MNTNIKYGFFIFLIIVLGALAFFYIKGATKNHSMPESGHMNETIEHQKKVTCPIMGTEMTMKQVYDTAEYNGKTYYFCCGGCKPAFLKNPKKYTN
jgi:YHS domain-containing protein